MKDAIKLRIARAQVSYLYVSHELLLGEVRGMPTDAPTDLSPPDKTLDDTDRGDDVQRRFRYQAAIAAILSLELLHENSEFDEILCEHHEDILVKRKDGVFIGYQVKTRELSRGPFTFNSPEIMRTLERFIESDKKFPQHFKRYVIAANCGFSRKHKDYRNLEYCGKTLRNTANAGSILSNNAFNEKIEYLSTRTNCSKDFVINVLRKVWVQETPSMKDYEVYLSDQIAQITANKNLSHVSLRQAALSLIETMLQAASLTHRSPRSAYFALLDGPHTVRTDAIIEGKRITKAVVQKVLSESLGLAETERWQIAGIHDLIDLSTRDEEKIKVSFRKYASRIVNDYHNFSSFDRRGVKPIIEQLSKFDLKKYFVPIKLQDLDNRLKDVAEDMIMEWTQKDSRSGLFILGDFGTGKSTICAYMSYRLAAGFLNNTNDRIPIFIPLRYIDRISEESILSVISDVMKTDWETLSWLSASGKLVFILDGFDEIVKRTHWKKTLSDFQAIVKLLCKGKSKIIVTCRTHYFLKDSVIWGEETELMESLRATKNFKITFVQPFKEKQILDLLTRRTRDPYEVWNKIRSTYNLEDLCERPLLLDMIVSTLPRLISLGIPINAATLYETYTEDWINREDWRSQLTRDQKAVLMEKLACDMFVQEKSSIPFYDLGQIIKTEFKTKPESEVADYYDYDIRTCSFFKRDSKGNYFFMHRSFLEFFVAKKIAKEINFGSIPHFLDAKSLPNEIVFFAGLMINPKCKEVLVAAVYKTKGKSLDKTGLLGGNAMKLYEELSGSLTDKDFSLCTIRDVRLHSFSIQRCKFEKAKLKSVEIDSGNLEKCSFAGAHFDSCKLIDTKISNVNFIETRFVESEFAMSEFVECPMNSIAFKKCNFEHVKIVGSDMIDTSFHGCDAGLHRFGIGVGVLIIESNLQSVKFSNSNILLSAFHKSNLQDAHFISCDLGGTCLNDCDLRSSYFDYASLSFVSITNSKFDNSVFAKTRLFRTFMNRSEMGHITFKQTSVKENDRKFHSVSGSGVETKIKFHPNLSAFCALNRAIEKLALGDSLEEEIIKKFSLSWDSLSTRIRSLGRTNVIAAWFYATTKETDRPRPLRLVAGLFRIHRIDLSRVYRELLRSGRVTRTSVDPRLWVEIYAKELNITKKSVVLAKEIIGLSGRALQGRRPSTIASSALYLACKENSEKVTLKSIAAVASLSTVAIYTVNKLLSKIFQSARTSTS